MSITTVARLPFLVDQKKTATARQYIQIIIRSKKYIQIIKDVGYK